MNGQKELQDTRTGGERLWQRRVWGARPAWGVTMGSDRVVAELQGDGVRLLGYKPFGGVSLPAAGVGEPRGTLIHRGDHPPLPAPVWAPLPNPRRPAGCRGTNPDTLRSSPRLIFPRLTLSRTQSSMAMQFPDTQFSCPLVGWLGFFFFRQLRYLLSSCSLHLSARDCPCSGIVSWPRLAPLQAGHPQRQRAAAARGEPADRAVPGTRARGAPRRALGDLRWCEAELQNRQRAGTVQRLTLRGLTATATWQPRSSLGTAGTRPSQGPPPGCGSPRPAADPCRPCLASRRRRLPAPPRLFPTELGATGRAQAQCPQRAGSAHAQLQYGGREGGGVAQARGRSAPPPGA